MKRKTILALIPAISLLLSGCTLEDITGWLGLTSNDQETKPSGDETTPSGEKTPTQVFQGSLAEAFFYEFELNVKVPDYKAYEKNAYIDVDDENAAYGILSVCIDNSTTAEMESYIVELKTAGWAMGDIDSGMCYGTYGEGDDAQIMLFDCTDPADLEENEDPSIWIYFTAYTPTDELQHLRLDCDSEVYEKDEGVIHQVAVENYKFDIVGFVKEDEAVFGSIKKDQYGSYTYNGMIYNRNLVDNLESIRVNFHGGHLYYKFTDFLMEDMNFDGAQEVESGTRLEAPEGAGYFVLYTLGNEKVTIRSLDVTRDPNGTNNYKMIFDKSFESTMGGARSNAKSAVLENDLIELENNPTVYTNNYSGSEKHDGHTNPDTWYRWNGRYFANSANLGTDFTFKMTIIGDYSRMIDESKFFHYNVWPQFAYENCFTTQGGQENPSNTYAQTYIGNDNYEPLGSEGALNPSDPNVAESYAGRFFTDYGYDETLEDWMFLNPDTNTIEEDGNITFRQAYERYNLPFWNLEFHVFLDTEGEYAWEGEDPQPVCQISINGMVLYTYTIFEHYDMNNPKNIFINTMPMHLVNYGVKNQETGEYETYKGSFTYPRLVD